MSERRQDFVFALHAPIVCQLFFKASVLLSSGKFILATFALSLESGSGGIPSAPPLMPAMPDAALVSADHKQRVQHLSAHQLL